MKWKTAEPRPYYSKYPLIAASGGNNWFACYRLPGDVLVICEPQHLQEVNVFLIFGTERVLMMDTGMGICDIRPLVEELCGMEDAARGRTEGSYFKTLEVVNCHRHFDHVGNNWRFDSIWAVDDPMVRKQAESGIEHMPIANQSDPDMFLFGYPEGFRPEEYCIRPYQVRPCEGGHLFELGERTVEFLSTPGHTEDHAMLYDHRDGILFAGDMIYFGAIYAQFCSDFMGHSDIGQYISSLRGLRTRCPGLKQVYVSHNDFITDQNAIDLIADAMEAVLEGRAEGTPLRDEKYGYYMDPPTMKQYFFDGFSIVAAE